MCKSVSQERFIVKINHVYPGGKLREALQYNKEKAKTKNRWNKP